MLPKLQAQHWQRLRFHPPITLRILLPRLQNRRSPPVRPNIHLLNILILLLILLDGFQQILSLLQPDLPLCALRFIEIANVIFLHINNPIRKSRNRSQSLPWSLSIHSDGLYHRNGLIRGGIFLFANFVAHGLL